MKIFKLVLIAIVIWFGLFVQAQTPKIDSLINALKHGKGKDQADAAAELSFAFYAINPDAGIGYGTKALRMADSLKDDGLKSKILNNIGANYLVLSRFEQARSSFIQAQDLAAKNKDSVQLAIIYNRLGVLYEKIAVYDSALLVFEQALQLSKALNDYAMMARQNENMGMIHLHRGELKSSLVFLLRAKTDYEQAGKKQSIPSLYLKIGRVCTESHDYTAAEKWYINGKQLSLGYGDINTAALATNALGILYKEQNLLPKALAQFHEVLSMLEKTNNKSLSLAVNNNIGNAYANLGEAAKALVYRKKALELAEALKEPATIAIQQVSLSDSYNTLGNHAEALKLLTNALSTFRTSKRHDNLLSTYQGLIQATKGLKNYALSVEYYEKFVKLKDSLSKKEQNTALDSLRVKFNTEQTLNENLLLAQKNLVQSKTISLQKAILLSIILFAVLMIGFVVFVIKSRQKIRSANQLLAAQNDEITAKAHELDAKNRQLVELSQFKDSMNSFLVHDLKNPLNTIINANWNQLSPQEAEGIKQSGYRMLNIVSSLLDISKHENEMLNIFIADTQIAEVIRDAFNETRFLAKQKNIGIALKFQSNFLLKVDTELIKRVFVNILTNAIKFSQTNGQIQVFAEALSDSNLKISIKDDGEGIAAEYLPFVFERFTQGIPRNVGLTSSTGIGMAFCKMAIELHGGEIGVDSIQGNGSTFWFTLPMVATDAADQTFALPDTIEPDSFTQLKLSKNEKEYLMGLCKQLKQLTIYQLSEVKDVVKPIESSSAAITLWKQLVLESLAACNETNYHKLTNLCHD